mgnify:FL=1
MDRKTQGKVEKLFRHLDEGATLLAGKGRSYLDALIIMGESVCEGELVVSFFNEKEQQARDVVQRVIQERYHREDVRRAFQLAVLRGFQEIKLPAGALITPDAVCLLMAHLVKRFIGEQSPLSIVDLACGSGNLLTAVLNHLSVQGAAYGLEIDPLLIRLAYINANLQQHEIQFYRQDALERIFFPQVDVVLADLPVGEYTNSQTAQYFDLYRENEPLYVHHLMMEQALHIAQEGAYLFFLIPNGLFTERGADRLRQLITSESYIQALLELPGELFQAGSLQKSIFILQKKGEGVEKPNSTLLARLPHLMDREKMTQAWQDIQSWLEENKQKGRGA